MNLPMRSYRAVGSGLEPMEDFGFFGPDSVTWKVWGHPAALTVGFQRAVVVEELDPFLLASVDQSGKVRARPRSRYDRTIRYFATVAFGDARTAIRASEHLVKVHSYAVGVEPISGLRYDANDPASQLWIHLTGWHSVLYAYERYGPGPLSPEEDARYWEECAVAAELQTCDPADVPRTRDGVRGYFAAVRPRLAASEAAVSMMRHLLDAGAVLPPLPAVARPGARLASATLRAATIATMPRWMRDLAGLRQPAAVDAAVTPVMRAHFRALSASPRLQLAALAALSPSTVPVAGPMLAGIPPRSDEVLTPAQARERLGSRRPVELWQELLDRAEHRAPAAA